MLFQSTHPLRGATILSRPFPVHDRISIHAPLAGCDFQVCSFTATDINFNPRTPCGVRRLSMTDAAPPRTFQSTHPLRGATWVPIIGGCVNIISIHAPLAGCDLSSLLLSCGPLLISIHAPLAGCDIVAFECFQVVPISIHAPLAGCDQNLAFPRLRRRLFQSTHPLRGATADRFFCDRDQHISIHAPLAGCDIVAFECFQVVPISIHAPLAGCDQNLAFPRLRRRLFQSTHPLRGATADRFFCDRDQHISIHAPLAGCDFDWDFQDTDETHFNPRTPCGVRPELVCLDNQCRNFNPRTPCGVRHHWDWNEAGLKGFQSTHPLRGATLMPVASCSRFSISIHAPLAGCDGQSALPHSQQYQISIHAPLAGCDEVVMLMAYQLKNFNPRTPCGVRRLASLYLYDYQRFQSTHPLRGATITSYWRQSGISISIHAPLAGCDCIRCDFRHKDNGFQSTHPLRGATWQMGGSEDA